MRCQSVEWGSDGVRVQVDRADRRQAELDKWRSYAGAAPIGQAVIAMKMPRARWLAYLLRPCLLALSVHVEPSAAPLRFAAESTPSPSSLAVASLLTPASPRLHLLPLELVHLATEPTGELR